MYCYVPQKLTIHGAFECTRKHVFCLAKRVHVLPNRRLIKELKGELNMVELDYLRVRQQGRRLQVGLAYVGVDDKLPLVPNLIQNG